MKKLVAGLIALSASFTYAQDKAVQTVNVPVYCVQAKPLQDVLDEYSELPFMKVTSVRTVDGKQMSFPSIIFINMETQTYTIVERIADTTYCIIASGGDLQPVAPSVRDDIIKRRQKSKI